MFVASDVDIQGRIWWIWSINRAQEVFLSSILFVLRLNFFFDLVGFSCNFSCELYVVVDWEDNVILMYQLFVHWFTYQFMFWMYAKDDKPSIIFRPLCLNCGLLLQYLNNWGVSYVFYSVKYFLKFYLLDLINRNSFITILLYWMLYSVNCWR